MGDNISIFEKHLNKEAKKRLPSGSIIQVKEIQGRRFHYIQRAVVKLTSYMVLQEMLDHLVDYYPLEGE